MHIVPEFEPVKVVWLQTKKVQIFRNRKTLDTYLKQFGEYWFNQLPSKNQKTCPRIWRGPADTEDRPMSSIALRGYWYPPDLVLRDIWGNPLFREDFKTFRVEYVYSGPRWHPGSKRNYGHAYRHPRSHSINRQLEGMAANPEEFEDLQVTASARQVHRLVRRTQPLPTAWTDIRIGARYNRNWKRFRKTQYKDR